SRQPADRLWTSLRSVPSPIACCEEVRLPDNSAPPAPHPEPVYALLPLPHQEPARISTVHGIIPSEGVLVHPARQPDRILAQEPPAPWLIPPVPHVVEVGPVPKPQCPLEPRSVFPDEPRIIARTCKDSPAVVLVPALH